MTWLQNKGAAPIFTAKQLAVLRRRNPQFGKNRPAFN
jgi:hypothetical protein